MANDFKSVGNLAFYDKWSPDYVYFSSLLTYANTISDNYHGGWNPDDAMKIAFRAVNDAQAHLHFKDSKEESDEYFLNKFTEIINFLELAIEAEKANEKAYIEDLYHQLKSTFNREEKQKLKQLYELEKLLKDSVNSDHIEYDKMNTLINVLLQGFNNTKTILAHEKERIEKINSIVGSLLRNRKSQTAALHRARDPITRDKIANKSLHKLYRDFETEYASHGQLTRRDGKKNGPYVLWGAAKIETDVPRAIDRIMAEWVEKMMDKIIHDKKFIKKIQSTLQTNYPKDGEFRWLEEDIQEDIIQAVIQSGISDLSAMLKDEITNDVIKKVEKNIQKNGLDLTANLNIKNLTPSFGLISKQVELMEDAHSIKDLEEKEHASQLFDAIRTLIREEEKISDETGEKSKSLLIRAMKSNRNSKGESSLDRTEKMISFIDSVEKLQKKLNQANKKWRKLIQETQRTQEVYNKTININKDISINIEIKNGQVTINQNELSKLKSDVFQFKSFNPQSIKTALNTLKARATINLRTEVINSLKKANFGITEQALISHVSQELRNVRVKINGPTLAELMTGLYLRKSGTGIMIDWNKYLGKNDSVSIITDHRGIIRRFNGSKFYKNNMQFDDSSNEIQNAIKAVENAQENLLFEYQNLIDKNVKKLTRTGDLQKYSKLQAIMETDIEKDRTQDKELNEAYLRLQEATKKLQHTLKTTRLDTQLSKEQIDELGQAYLNTLKNAFYVSTTVKSANDYMNSIGFKGGSLGSTLDAQLSHISDIFASAGVPIQKDDYEWLKSAIINCFPGSVVGEKNKYLLENYLGSLAAFALFDEGGVESAIVEKFRNNLLESIKTGQAQKIIHLYVVDGIYVKGSTVLERTLNTLKKDIIPNIQNIPRVMRRGAGILIINTASDTADIVPNRPYKKHLENASPNAWIQTGQTVANKHVKLQILFLAGLLDIIKKINATLSQVEQRA